MVPKRLLIVTHTFLPHVGGIERVVYEQGKRLMRCGFDVTVLTSRMDTAESYVVDGIKVRCYDSLNAAFGLGIPYPIPQINSFKPFLKCVNASNLIHVHGHPYLSSLIAAKLAKRHDKPVVLTQHNTFIEYESSFWDHIEWFNETTVALTVRRLVYKNGIDTLIQTAEKATKHNPKLVFLVIGTGPDRETVQEKVQQL